MEIYIFLEDYPMTLPAKFGSNWHSSFREEDFNIEVYR
jgi:hypothetical protein